MTEFREKGCHLLENSQDVMQFDPAQVERWLEELKRIWPTSTEIERWLDEVFDPPWPRDIRRAGAAVQRPAV